jgi:hypothetical protein
MTGTSVLSGWRVVMTRVPLISSSIIMGPPCPGRVTVGTKGRVAVSSGPAGVPNGVGEVKRVEKMSGVEVAGSSNSAGSSGAIWALTY